MLEEYQKIYEQAEEDLKISGKTIQDACRDFPSLKLFYYDKWAELKHQLDDVEIEIKKLQAVYTKKYTQNYSISLGERQVVKYIEMEEGLVMSQKRKAEILEMVRKFEGVKDAFTSLGFQLNNITKLRVASIEEGLL
jgi:hypothetical protein